MFTQVSGLECLSPEAPVTIIQYLRPPIRHPPLPAPSFLSWMTFLTNSAKATLSPLQVGQPNRAIRQDIHHYPVGWSKWPWCSLHTQFQIPLGFIMRRFKQRERGRPSHLILKILDVISVWCSVEKENTEVQGGGWDGEGESAGDESAKENKDGVRGLQEMRRGDGWKKLEERAARRWLWTKEDRLLFKDFSHLPRNRALPQKPTVLQVE